MDEKRNFFLVSVVAIFLSFRHVTCDLCEEEFTGQNQCIVNSIRNEIANISWDHLDSLEKQLSACFNQSRCPRPPAFNVPYWKTVPQAYANGIQDAMAFWDGIEYSFKQCVSKKHMLSMLDESETCIQKTIPDYRKPTVYADIPYPRRGREETLFRRFWAMQLVTSRAISECQQTSPMDAANLERCHMAEMDNARLGQSSICKIQKDCRQKLQDRDKRRCSTRLDRFCSVLQACTPTPNENAQGFGYLKLGSNDNEVPESVNLHLLRQNVRDCERELNITFPMNEVMSILTRSPSPNGGAPKAVSNVVDTMLMKFHISMGSFYHVCQYDCTKGYDFLDIHAHVSQQMPH